MQRPRSLFGWFIAVSAFVAIYRLRAAPPGVLLLILPTFALFQLLWLSDILNSKPPNHWLLKTPGLKPLSHALRRALALPEWARVVVVVGSIALGLGLSHLV
ncbi:hypothetical protein [Salinisphaera shabanensis]|uniref:hypothetical protein n=1 Tax=Salinisphaera shabanensis TaxID=180542 RepID=UPI00333EF69D